MTRDQRCVAVVAVVLAGLAGGGWLLLYSRGYHGFSEPPRVGEEARAVIERLGTPHYDSRERGDSFSIMVLATSTTLALTQVDGQPWNAVGSLAAAQTRIEATDSESDYRLGYTDGVGTRHHLHVEKGVITEIEYSSR